MEEPKEKQKEKKVEEKFSVGDLPTQTEPRIVNNKTNEVYTIEQGIVLILNNQEKLLKLLD
ncbi:hypothetical protein LCGC14_0374390 [marine sediment metagenome]|uniref:Uncharacterized protein n=1 Tax=marine sediment metagenome TaxID=412755 RepID=A0A0F9TA15_9ZZZZ